MKKIILLSLFLFNICFLQAKPKNLYEQLCEINQEWYKNKAIAEELGFFSMKPIEDEQEILSFHIHTLEKIFAQRTNPHLSEAQKANRSRNIQVLNEYWKRYDCPRNYYLSYRNPVFIDHEGRYCAVAYLMLKSGKKDFCEAVQKSNNFIFIRQINSEEFSQWQGESGFTLDELAWIQPGYAPVFNFAKWQQFDAKGMAMELDSIASIKMYKRFAKTNPDSPKDMDTTFQYERGVNNRIFWGMRMNGKLAAESIAYQGDADFSPFEKRIEDGGYNYTLSYISAITLYQNELYVAMDSTEQIMDSDSTYTPHYCSYILKWDSGQKTWKTLNSIEQTVYCFFEVEGELYAGGGQQLFKTYNEGTDEQIWDEYTDSYLAKLENGTFKEDPTEYWGIIFGMIVKNNKNYLGLVYNNMGGSGKDARLPLSMKEEQEGRTGGGK